MSEERTQRRADREVGESQKGHPRVDSVVHWSGPGDVRGGREECRHTGVWGRVTSWFRWRRWVWKRSGMDLEDGTAMVGLVPWRDCIRVMGGGDTWTGQDESRDPRRDSVEYRNR